MSLVKSSFVSVFIFFIFFCRPQGIQSHTHAVTQFLIFFFKWQLDGSLAEIILNISEENKEKSSLLKSSLQGLWLVKYNKIDLRTEESRRAERWNIFTHLDLLIPRKRKLLPLGNMPLIESVRELHLFIFAKLQIPSWIF